MLLKSIHLVNFRQYKDFKMNFPESSGVTVIRANNSMGKTTLMQSVKWALFGTSIIDLDHSNDLLNYDVAENYRKSFESEATYFVELVVSHNGITYTVKRSETVDVVSKKINAQTVELSFLENGETKIIKNIDAEKSRIIYKTIESWISEKMINYFFLDGERIEKLSKFDRESQTEISEAITSVSKIPILNNALETIEEVLKTIKRDEAKATRDIEIINLNKEIETFLNQKKNFEQEKSELQLLNASIREKLNLTEKQLSSIEQVAELQAERSNYDKELENSKEKMNKIKSDIQNLYREYKHKQLVYMLFKKYNVDDLRGNEASKTIPNMEVEAINHIIKNGVCICGNHLEEQNILTLEEQKKYQPPISNEGLIKSYEHAVELETVNIDKCVTDINDRIEEYFSEETTRNKLIDHLKYINGKINQFNESDIKELNKKRQDFIINEEENKNRIAELNFKIKNLIPMIEKKEKAKRKKLVNLEQSKLIEMKMYLIKEAKSQLSNLSKKEKEKQRQSIQNFANKHFSDIISKQKSVEIDSEYNHTVLDASGNKTSLSSGESIALSVSIILAIIDTHRENLKRNNQEDLLTEKDFFLVLDGAFAVLDQNFSKAIAEKITERLNQVIILTNDNQYTTSVKEAIAPKLLKEYKLKVDNKNEEDSLSTKNIEEVE